MDKKTVVITGSTRGIGKSLALQFLKRNHQVIINGRKREAVDDYALELKNKGFEVLGVAGDVTREITHQSIIDEALKKYTKIDIWINNAGIPQSQKYFHELTSEEIQNVSLVNIVGTMMGTKAAINYFKQQGFGKVFNMEGFGSDGRMLEKLSLYGTSKRAVNYFTKSISKEVEKDIHIGVLSPGMVRTDFLINSMKTGSTEEQARNKKVFDILAEDVDVVTDFLVKKILVSEKHYDRIDYLTKRRLLPKLIKLLFVK